MRMSFMSIPLLFLGGCAATSEISMSPEELKQCLQPNRRVVIEVVGLVQKPPPKKPAAPPPEAKAAEAKPEAQPAAEAKPKPVKPEMAPFEETLHVQGDHAFDFGTAALKDGGRQEIDEMLALLKKRAVQVNAIIVQGHTDRLEADSGNKTLSEQRAVAAKDYLVSRGQNEKVIFWEGKGATTPVPVTKFCAS